MIFDAFLDPKHCQIHQENQSLHQWAIFEKFSDETFFEKNVFHEKIIFSFVFQKSSHNVLESLCDCQKWLFKDFIV